MLVTFEAVYNNTTIITMNSEKIVNRQQKHNNLRIPPGTHEVREAALAKSQPFGVR